jgi:hypothetical protein
VCGVAGFCTAGLIGQGCTHDGQCDEDKNNDGVCNQDDCWINHFVVLVGYDDAGGYWIAKNSYGNTWRGDGYWEVGYGECHIEQSAYYVEPADINFPPVARVGGPYSVECQGSTSEVPLDGSGSDDPNAGDTLTFDWVTDCPGGSFDDVNSATPVLTFDTSLGCLVECSVSLTVTDDDVATDTATSRVTIRDSELPTIAGPADVTVECDQSTDPSHTGYATATDSCDPDPAITYADEITPGACAGEYMIERTWTATDDCGNSVGHEQTITVVDDIPPVITPPSDITVECDQPTDPSHTGYATAVDGCDPAPTITYADVETPGSCLDNKTIVRTWTAADDCGNSASGAQTITVADTTPPTIKCNAPGTITPPDAPISFIPTATDNCDDDPPVTITDFECFKFTKNGKRIDKDESCRVDTAGDSLTIRNTGGIGSHIAWDVRAVDNCGQVTESECEVEIVRKGGSPSSPPGQDKDDDKVPPGQDKDKDKDKGKKDK